MAAMIVVLLGFILVTAATFSADWAKAQWPAAFGLSPAGAPARRGLDR